jgi:hypothetical protein
VRLIRYQEVLIMWRTLGAIVLGTAICSAGVLISRADELKAATHDIKGGVEGRVKSVDPDKEALTVVLENGRTRTFTITEETTMLGPRGGKVRHRLKDPRFREGFPVIIVPEGNTAAEVHLGFARDAETKAGGAEPATRVTRPRPTEPETEPAPRTTRPRPTPTDTEPATTSPGRAASKTEEDDDEAEIPGMVKRIDPSRRILVVTLLNGKDRSFILPSDIKVLVRGAASRQGLRDPALKAGTHIDVITEEGGHKVKEVKVLLAGRKKAG